jgi:hypothetical protein
MVYYILARGTTGFSIISENNEISLGVPNIDIKVPTETIMFEYNVNNRVTQSGRIKFETENEIVIKDKIAYIR